MSLALIRCLGGVIIIYLDDILTIGKSAEE